MSMNNNLGSLHHYVIRAEKEAGTNPLPIWLNKILGPWTGFLSNNLGAIINHVEIFHIQSRYGSNLIITQYYPKIFSHKLNFYLQIIQNITSNKIILYIMQKKIAPIIIPHRFVHIFFCLKQRMDEMAFIIFLEYSFCLFQPLILGSGDGFHSLHVHTQSLTGHSSIILIHTGSKTRIRCSFLFTGSGAS